MRVLVVPRSAVAPAAALDALLPLGALDAAEDPAGLHVLFAEDPALERLVRHALALPADAPLVWRPPLLRDTGATALLEPRPRRVGPVWLVPVAPGAATPAAPGEPSVLLHDGVAFGTGAHPTTALCLEALGDAPLPAHVLDLGCGNGVLALAALRLGAATAVGVDLDGGAVAEAEANAALNGLSDRLAARHGGPSAAGGRAPLVLANILAAPLVALAHEIAACVAHDGELVLSGVPTGLEHEVARAYVYAGMRRGPTARREGWSCLRLRAGW